jgi:hypothetical protein
MILNFGCSMKEISAVISGVVSGSFASYQMPDGAIAGHCLQHCNLQTN